MADILELMSDKVFDLYRDIAVDTSGDFAFDFLGVRSHVGFNASWAPARGKVKPKPRGSWEWIPLLWSVATSGPGTVLMECGAGWGPWIVRGHAAARQLGRDPIRIIGVEAEEHHHGYMLRHFADNGIGAAEGRAVMGIVAAESGIALFPVATDPSREWGLRMLGRTGHDRGRLLAELAASPVTDRPGHYTVVGRPQEYRLVPAFSLEELMAGHTLVDFIHFDIQGAEGAVIAAGIASLNAQVRCIAVGTHSAEIEGDLRKIMPANDWICVHDESQKMRPNGVLGDGTQVWVNRRML